MSPLPYGETRQVIALGDFDHDGYLDIVLTSQDDNTVLVLLNNGDGTFGRDVPYVKYEVGAYPVAVAVGDFNHDGNLDIVTGNDDNTLTVLLGNGDGTFRAALSPRPSVGTIPGSIALGDIDHDGNLDIVTDNDDGTVWILLGNGDGTFQPYQHYPVGDQGGSVALGDLTHDRILDIVTTNGHYANNAITVSLGKGDGTFQPYHDYNVSLGPNAIALGDVNHDGNLDIITASAGGTLQPRYHIVSVLLGKGDGTFQPYQYYSLGIVDAPIAVAVGDFTNDGNLDIVTANAANFNVTDDGTVAILLNQGDGTFQSPQSYYPVGAGPVTLAVGDVDNDGNLDIVTANFGDALITVFYGNGDGTFGPAPAIRQR